MRQPHRSARKTATLTRSRIPPSATICKRVSRVFPPAEVKEFKAAIRQLERWRIPHRRVAFLLVDGRLFLWRAD
jgi:hypothetical protein